MRRLLIISFSPIHRDPRVLRQVNLFREDFDVVTCGHGTAPEGVAAHIQIPDSAVDWRPSILTRTALYALRRHEGLYEDSERVRTARAGIAANGPFDGVLANDAMALPLATSLGLPVHADMHEFATETGSTRAWRALVRPFMQWALDFLPRCVSVSTVAPGIAARYQREFGVQPGVVPNCPEYRDDLKARATGTPIRIVHAGAAAPARSLDLSIDAVTKVNAEHPGALELDLYLVPGSPAYIEQMRELAGDAAVSGVRLREPVEFSRLIDVMHGYDIGLFFAPPVTYNLKHVLPNKFFEYVQARLGVIIGPSIEMGPYLDQYQFGAVTQGWGVEDLSRTLRGLTPQIVDEWKARADAAALELNAEVGSQVWVDSVTSMLE